MLGKFLGILNAANGGGGEEKKKKLVFVEKQQPSGRVLAQWPNVKDDMLTAVAAHGSSAFLTDAELAEIDKSMVEKAELEERTAELSKKYGLSATIIDSFIFRQALPLLENKPTAGDAEPPELPVLFCLRWLPVRMSEEAWEARKTRLQAPILQDLTLFVQNYLQAAVDDLPDKLPTNVQELRNACQNIVHRILTPLDSCPPDKMWSDQIASVRMASYPLMSKTENECLAVTLGSAFDLACKAHGVTNLEWPEIPEISLAWYIHVSDLWRDKLDVAFVAANCKSLDMLALFNSVADPSWIELPGAGFYVRARGYMHTKRRAWLSDGHFVNTSHALYALAPHYSAHQWQHALLATVRQLTAWTENDVCDV